MTLTFDYSYATDQVRVFEPGESSFPIEKATAKEKGVENDDTIE
jgi:hypothetical protein